MASSSANPFAETGAIRRFRLKHGMNQLAFWSRVGVTQSGGSRYESGRKIPKAVLFLLNITYGTDRGSEKVVKKLRAWKNPVGGAKV